MKTPPLLDPVYDAAYFGSRMAWKPEGFWSYVKGGLKSFKSVSPKYLPFYLVQYEWQYNHRNYKGNQFEAFLTNALQREKELEYWKAESPEQVKDVAYG